MYHNQREIKRTFSPPSDLIKYRNYLYFEYVMYLSVIEYFADFVIELGNLEKIKICKDYIFFHLSKNLYHQSW